MKARRRAGVICLGGTCHYEMHARQAAATRALSGWQKLLDTDVGYTKEIRHRHSNT